MTSNSPAARRAQMKNRLRGPVFVRGAKGAIAHSDPLYGGGVFTISKFEQIKARLLARKAAPATKGADT